MFPLDEVLAIVQLIVLRASVNHRVDLPKVDEWTLGYEMAALGKQRPRSISTPDCYA